MLKLSDVTFDESIVVGGRSVRTPADLGGKLLGEVTAEEIVGVILHGAKAPATGKVGNMLQKAAEGHLSDRLTRVMVMDPWEE